MRGLAGHEAGWNHYLIDSSALAKLRMTATTSSAQARLLRDHKARRKRRQLIPATLRHCPDRARLKARSTAADLVIVRFLPQAVGGWECLVSTHCGHSGDVRCFEDERAPRKLPLRAYSPDPPGNSSRRGRMQLLDMSAHRWSVAPLRSRGGYCGRRKRLIPAGGSRARPVALPNLRLHDPLDTDRSGLPTHGGQPQDVRSRALARSAAPPD